MVVELIIGVVENVENINFAIFCLIKSSVKNC